MANDEYRAWQETQEWPSTTGIITQFHIGQRISSNRLRVQIRTKYEVGGLEYTGQEFSPECSKRGISRFEAEMLDRDYRKGMQTLVYYHPGDPGHSFVQLPGFADAVAAPGIIVLLGLWILYLLWKTRIRRAPRHLFENAEDLNSLRWHKIYQSVLEEDQLVIQGSAWYPRSKGLTQWPNSRVGLIATPNTIAVVRGPFRASGVLAAILTICFEFIISCFLPLIHAVVFLNEWIRRSLTWRVFKRQTSPNAFYSYRHTTEIVSIDATIIYGYDNRTQELWYRLPSRPIDDSIRIRRHQIERIEQFMAFVRLMQQSSSLDDRPEDGD